MKLYFDIETEHVACARHRHRDYAGRYIEIGPSDWWTLLPYRCGECRTELADLTKTWQVSLPIGAAAGLLLSVGLNWWPLRPDPAPVAAAASTMNDPGVYTLGGDTATTGILDTRGTALDEHVGSCRLEYSHHISGFAVCAAVQLPPGQWTCVSTNAYMAGMHVGDRNRLVIAAFQKDAGKWAHYRCRRTP